VLLRALYFTTIFEDQEYSSLRPLVAAIRCAAPCARINRTLEAMIGIVVERKPIELLTPFELVPTTRISRG
jgi:hypothetical protein